MRVPLRLYCIIFSELGVLMGIGGGAPRGGMGGLSVSIIAELCWYWSHWAASCSCCINCCCCCASSCCCLCICRNSVWVCGISDLCDARNASTFCASLRRCWFCRCVCRNSTCTVLGECWFGDVGSRLITEFLRSISGVETRLLPVDTLSSTWSNPEFCSRSKPSCCIWN